MEWREDEDEDEARTSLYEQDEYQMYSGNPLDDPNYVPNTEMVRAIYATDYYMVQVRGGHGELERAERFDRWLTQVKAEAWDEGHRHAQWRGPDDCTCEAWSEDECTCGQFGNGELGSLADNPYREQA